jgi:hypothetical protein
MGNWRTVNVIGTIAPEHVGPLHDWLGYSHDLDDPAMGRFGPLSFNRRSPSLCGLNAWPAERVSACGNLAERDYSVEDVAGELRRLVHVAPSMLLKVHCGGEYESGDCVATISVGEGVVAVGEPEQAKVTGPSEGQMMGNLLQNLLR